MKRSRIFYLIIFGSLFLTGALVFMYPSIANYFNSKNCSRVISSYSKIVEECDNEAIEAQWAKAREYNSQLYEHMIILSDPFDPNSFPITDEQYEDVLDLDEVMASIEIPAINVDLPIYHGTKPETLNKGVGHLENTSLPIGGESTHTVLSAHCGLPSAMLFTDLDRLMIGNIFKINVLNETHVYQVFSTEVVEPGDYSTLYINKGEDTVTLLTCTPYGENTHRLLVHGKRISDEEAEEVIENEPVIEKEMSSEDWLDIIMAALSVIFILFLVLIVMRSVKSDKDTDNE